MANKRSAASSRGRDLFRAEVSSLLADLGELAGEPGPHPVPATTPPVTDEPAAQAREAVAARPRCRCGCRAGTWSGWRSGRAPLSPTTGRCPGRGAHLPLAQLPPAPSPGRRAADGGPGAGGTVRVGDSPPRSRLRPHGPGRPHRSRRRLRSCGRRWRQPRTGPHLPGRKRALRGPLHLIRWRCRVDGHPRRSRQQRPVAGAPHPSLRRLTEEWVAPPEPPAALEQRASPAEPPTITELWPFMSDLSTAAGGWDEWPERSTAPDPPTFPPQPADASEQWVSPPAHEPPATGQGWPPPPESRGRGSATRRRMDPPAGPSDGMAVNGCGGGRGGRARAGCAARFPPSPGAAAPDLAIAGGATTRGGGRRSRLDVGSARTAPSSGGRGARPRRARDRRREAPHR